MIPLKLQIKNFLSYGSTVQIIDFAPYNLICLSGKNGHGKSALLDAITWAIWGQARKISGAVKPDDALLRLGQSQMFVMLDFLCNGQNYRIKREFTILQSKPIASLEFAIQDQKTTFFKPLTDKTIKTTQEKIIETVGLDYDTFINSAFLRQGQSNEFSKKSPKERKEILANILGLEKYEKIKKVALEKIKLIQSEKLHYTQIQEHTNKELNNKIDIENKLNILNFDIEQVEKQEYLLTLDFKKTEEKKNKILVSQNEKRLIEYKINQIKLILQDNYNKIIELVYRYRNSLKKIRLYSDKNNLIEQKRIIEKELLTAQESSQKKISLKQLFFENKQKEQTLKNSLEMRYSKEIEEKKLSLREVEINYFNSGQKQIELNNEHKLIIVDIKNNFFEQQKLSKIETELSKLEINFEQETKFFEKRKAFYQKHVAVGNKVASEIKSCEQQQQIAGNVSDPICPLCKQNLDLNIKQNLLNNLHAKKSLATNQFKRISTVLSNLKLHMHAQHEELKKAEKKILEYKQCYQNLKRLKEEEVKLLTKKELIEKQLSIIDQDLQKNKNYLDTIQNALDLSIKNKENLILNNQEYKLILNNLIKIESDIENIKTDFEDIAKISAKLDTIKSVLELSAITEISLQQERKIEIKKLIEQTRNIKKELTNLNNELVQYANSQEVTNNILKHQEQVMLNLKNILDQKNILIQKKLSLEAQCRLLQKLEQDLHKNKESIKILENQLIDYQAIAIALSQDGIQALLIEDALPEIEQEANAILATLTDNQAQIIIESLKDLKSGQVLKKL